VTGANVSERSAVAGQGGVHVLGPRILIGTAAALGVLTAITVGAAQVDLGRMNVVIALGIASAKATLVALYFMHLRWGARFHLVVLAGAVAFAVLLTAFVVLDTTEYQPDVRAKAAAAAPGGAPRP